jgi:hypothetical protein
MTPMPATMLVDRFTTHLRRVETLAAAGIPAPKEWAALYARFTDYRGLQMAVCDQLIAAILAPSKGADVTTLHALAVAEQIGVDMSGIQARVDQRVAAAIEARLAELYRPHAEHAYRTAQSRFDAIASDFAAAARVTDVEITDAESVAAMDDDQRQAWTAAAALAAKLDTALSLLTVAAQLAGADVNNETGSVISLCVDTTTAAKRDCWSAWDTKTGRTGRWGQLVKTGAQIRAATLETVQPYPRPRDIEYRQEPIPGAPRGYYQTVAYDPELGERPPEPEKAMIPGRMLTR